MNQLSELHPLFSRDLTRHMAFQSVGFTLWEKTLYSAYFKDSDYGYLDTLNSGSYYSHNPG